jgi:hypothetical protein
MPKRFLKPTIRQSKRWNTASYFAQSLFIRLITIADDYGRYEADYRLLSNEAFPYGSPEGKNVEVSQVESAFKELQDSGMINRYEANGNWYFEINNWQERVRSASRYPDPPASPNPRPGRPTLYQVTPDSEWKSAPPPKVRDTESNEYPSKPVDAPPKVRDTTPRNEGTQSYSLKVTPSKCIHSYGDLIYDAYPRKVGKPAALRAIAAALKKGADPEELLEITKSFAKVWEGEADKTYCPHPATWFHQERFRDTPDTWRRSTPGRTPIRPESNQRQETIPLKML